MFTYKTMPTRGPDDPYVTADGLRRIYFDDGSWVVSWYVGLATKTKEIKRREAWEQVRERNWPFNSEKLKITLGIDGDGQESSFMNATLQSTGNDPNLEFSVAVHVEIPAEITDEEKLADYLGGIFGDVVHEHPVHVEIQLGPVGDGADSGGEDHPDAEWPDGHYVAWGYVEGSSQSQWWVARWSDDGPLSEEEIFPTSLEAETRARVIAAELGLEAWACDEFGPK